jgi:group I intron endonuclease
MRWSRHIRDSKNGSTCAIHQAIRKYGEDSFSASVLCICQTQEELDKKEDDYITEYDSMIYDNGYNMVRGGKGRAPNFHHAEEHRKKMSEYMKTRHVSEETKLRLSIARKGSRNNWSDATRQRVADASRKRATGHVPSQETRNKISNSLKGRPGRKHTEDTKKMISRSLMGHPGSTVKHGPRTEETKERIRAARLGTKASEETKQLLSEVHKKRHMANPIPHRNCKYTEDDIRYMRNNPDKLTIDELRVKYQIHRFRLLQIQNKEAYKYVKDLEPFGLNANSEHTQ